MGATFPGEVSPGKLAFKNHHLAKSISDAGQYQFTQWLDYYEQIWDKVVVAVSPNYTSQDCSNCGHRVKKFLSTRTHSCKVWSTEDSAPRALRSSCGVEICRDINAAINILKKGMKVLGKEWTGNGTSGQEGAASKDGKPREKTASTIDEKSEIASRFQ